MSSFGKERRARIDQITEELQMLIHVCRLIAARSSDADIADELVDLADSIDSMLDRLRDEIAALID